MTVIPLGDASRRPMRMPAVTIGIMVVNALVFVLELIGGDPFEAKWSVIPAQIAAGFMWGAVTTRLFERPRRLSSQPM